MNAVRWPGALRQAWRAWRRLWRRRPRIVELFPTPWPEAGATLADFVAALATGGEPAPRVPATAIGLARLPPGCDAAQALARLRSEGWRARPGLPPLRLTPDIDWAADPHGDDNWRVQLNMLRLLDPLVHAHVAGIDATAGPQAMDQALAWHRFHLAPPAPNPRAWGDLVTGLRTLRIAFLADQLRLGALPADPMRRDALASMLLSHWQRLVTPAFMRFTNHTIWDLHALEALVRLALPADDPRRVAWRQAIGARLDHLLSTQFGPDGLHRENSPQYHFVAGAMFRALAVSGWYDDSVPRLAPTLARAADMDRWMRLPDRRLLAIGDSDGSAPSADTLPAPARTMTGDRIEWLNSGGYTIMRRLHARQRGRWSTLAVKAGLAGPGHLHRDLLSFLWSESGCDIVIDAGKYAYDEGPLRDYFVGPSGHNLIIFDGRDCDTRATPELAHRVGPLEPTPWGVTAAARVRHLPVDVDHERRFHFAPGRWLVVVDRFAARGAIEVEHLTHLAPEFEATWRDGRFHVGHRDGRPLCVEVQSSLPLDGAVLRGVDPPRPQGWCSRGYRQAMPCPTLQLTGRARGAACVVLALSLEECGRLERHGDDRVRWRTVEVDLVLETGPLAEATITGSSSPAHR